MKVCKSVSNCKKLRIFIKSVVERSIIILSKQEYNYVYIEYGEIISASEIVNEYDAIYDVWNVYNIQNISDRKQGKFPNKFITEGDRKDTISKKASRKSKDTFPEKKRKHNVILTVFHETKNQTSEIVLVDNKPENVLKLNYSSDLNPVLMVYIYI